MNPPFAAIQWLARDREEELRAEVRKEAGQTDSAPARANKPRVNWSNLLAWSRWQFIH